MRWWMSCEHSAQADSTRCDRCGSRGTAEFKAATARFEFIRGSMSSDDPSGAGILDRAQVQFPFAGLRDDISQPHRVHLLGGCEVVPGPGPVILEREQVVGGPWGIRIGPGGFWRSSTDITEQLIAMAASWPPDADVCVSRSLRDDDDLVGKLPGRVRRPRFVALEGAAAARDQPRVADRWKAAFISWYVDAVAFAFGASRSKECETPGSTCNSVGTSAWSRRAA